jgi:hypothetical protein
MILMLGTVECAILSICAVLSVAREKDDDVAWCSAVLYVVDERGNSMS